MAGRPDRGMGRALLGKLPVQDARRGKDARLRAARRARLRETARARASHQLDPLEQGLRKKVLHMVRCDEVADAFGPQAPSARSEQGISPESPGRANTGTACQANAHKLHVRNRT